MTDIDPTQMKQQAFGTPKSDQPGNALGTSKKDDLTGMDEKIDIQQDTADGSTPRRRKTAKPEKTIEDAIDEGLSIADIEALQEEWNAYNRQEAFRKAAEEKKALADRVAVGRRKFADQLLAIADEHGVTIAEARDIFRAALKRKFPNSGNGSKGQ